MKKYLVMFASSLLLLSVVFVPKYWANMLTSSEKEKIEGLSLSSKVIDMLNYLLDWPDEEFSSLIPDVIRLSSSWACLEGCWLDSPDLILIEPDWLKMVFDTDWMSADDFFELEWVTVINWGYFWYEWEKFIPAWELRLADRIIPTTIDQRLDPNLSVRIHYDTENNSLKFSDEWDLINPPWDYVFFAWPMIIDNWVINGDLIWNTSHRNWKYARTFLIRKANWHPIIGISMNRINLDDLWVMLRNRAPLIGEFSVVNLDWWPSTSLKAGWFERNSDKKLPWFFLFE